MNYKLKNLEKQYSYDIRAALGDDEYRIAKWVSKKLLNKEYKNSEIFVAACIHLEVRKYILRCFGEQEFDNSIIGILDDMQNVSNVSDVQICILVRHAFERAYNKGWDEMIKRYEETVL